MKKNVGKNTYINGEKSKNFNQKMSKQPKKM